MDREIFEEIRDRNQKKFPTWSDVRALLPLARIALDLLKHMNEHGFIDARDMPNVFCPVCWSHAAFGHNENCPVREEKDDNHQ